MSAPDPVNRLLRVAVMLALPTLACFGYYTLDALPAERSTWAIAAVLAYPSVLIGTIGLVSALRRQPRSNRSVALWTMCAAVPLGLLTWLRW